MFGLEAFVTERGGEQGQEWGNSCGWKKEVLDVHSCGGQVEVRRMSIWCPEPEMMEQLLAWSGDDGGCSLLLCLCMEQKMVTRVSWDRIADGGDQA
jgi:hypothetical protein